MELRPQGGKLRSHRVCLDARGSRTSFDRVSYAHYDCVQQQADLGELPGKLRDPPHGACVYDAASEKTFECDREKDPGNAERHCYDNMLQDEAIAERPGPRCAAYESIQQV